MSQMESILRAVVGVDNKAREEAEKAFLHLVDTDFGSVVTSLGEYISPFGPGASQHSLRMLSLVLLARYCPIGEDDKFSSLSDTLRAQVKHELINALAKDESSVMHRHLVHCIVVLAEISLYRNEWPELIPAMFQCMSGAPLQRLSALKVLSLLTDKCMDSLSPHMQTVGSAVQACLADKSSPLFTRSQAIVCACKMVGNELSTATRKAFRSLVPAFFDVLAECAGSSNFEEMNVILLAFITLVSEQEEASFFRDHIDSAVKVVETLSSPQFPDGVRQLALELIISLTTSLPALVVTKNKKLIPTSVTSCMTMMTSFPEHNPSWGQTCVPSLDEDDEASNFNAGVFSFYCLTQAPVVKIKTIVEGILPGLKACLGNSDWRQRHAAFSALGELVTRIGYDRFPHRQMTEGLSDSHPRVRWAALRAIEALANAHGTKLQRNLHQVLIPTIMQSVRVVTPNGSRQIPRIQDAACKCLFALIEDIDSRLISPYAKPMLEDLMTILVSEDIGLVDVQKEVISTIAGIAGSMGDDFVPYYSVVVPRIKSILLQPAYPALLQLRYKAIEALTYIGISVPKEVFYQDAKDILQFYIASQASGGLAPIPGALNSSPNGTSAEDESEEYLLRSLTRICAALGREFSSCLPYVVPKILRQATGSSPNSTSAALQNLMGGGSISSSKSSNDDLARESDNPLAQLRASAEKNAASLELQAVACSMLSAFAYELKDAFLPYVMSTLDVMGSFVRYHQHEEVQKSSITILPDLAQCALLSITAEDPSCRCSPADAMAVCVRILHILGEAIVTDDNTDTLILSLGSVYLVLGSMTDLGRRLVEQSGLADAVNHSLLPARELVNLTESLMKCASVYDQRIQQRLARFNERKSKKRSGKALGGRKGKGAATTVSAATPVDEEEEGEVKLNAVNVAQLNAADERIIEQAMEAIGYLCSSHRGEFVPAFQSIADDVIDMSRHHHSPQARKCVMVVIHHLFEHGLPYVAPEIASAALNALIPVCAERLLLDVGVGIVQERAAFALGIASTTCGGNPSGVFDLTLMESIHAALVEALVRTKAFQLERCGGPFSYGKTTSSSSSPMVGQAELSDDDDEEDGQDIEEPEEGDGGEDYEEEEENTPEEMLQYAIDNMVTALGRLGFALLNRGEPGITLAQKVFTSLFTSGPVICDAGEATFVAKLIGEAVHGQNTNVLGEGGANVPGLIIFMSFLSAHKACEVDVKTAIWGLLKQLVSTMDDVTKSKLIQVIPENYRGTAIAELTKASSVA